MQNGGNLNLILTHCLPEYHCSLKGWKKKKVLHFWSTVQSKKSLIFYQVPNQACKVGSCVVLTWPKGIVTIIWYGWTAIGLYLWFLTINLSCELTGSRKARRLSHCEWWMTNACPMSPPTKLKYKSDSLTFRLSNWIDLCMATSHRWLENHCSSN